MKRLKEEKKIRDFIILEHLASGGCADIYRVAKLGANGSPSIFSIKILPAHSVNDRVVRNMFSSEACIMALLRHNNIVEFNEYIEEDDRVGIVMEFVHGKDLRQFINISKNVGVELELDLILYILNSVIHALGYVHSRCDKNGKLLDIVHRDINPKNILLSFDGNVKVVDFGIAQYTGGGERRSLEKCTGKLSYLAPEQFTGGEVDRRADIFALGVVLYEMISGSLLFPGETQSAIFESLKNRDIFQAINSLGIDKELKSILGRMVERDPSLRYATVQETGDSLLNYIRKKSILLRPENLKEKMMQVFPTGMEDEKEKRAKFTHTLQSEIQQNKKRRVKGERSGRMHPPPLNSVSQISS